MNHKLLTKITGLLGISICAAQAQFTAGDLVVLRDGTGSSALSSAGTAIFLDQYTTSPGGFVSTTTIPSTGLSALVDSGTATSEGQLSLSSDGRYLVVAGYNTNAGTTGVSGSSDATLRRGIATVDYNGNYSLVATTSTAFSGNNIRSGTTDGNGNFWAVGANSGIAYMGTGPTNIVSTTSLNNRVIQNVGGNLYFSTASGTARGVYKITGNPTSGSSTAVQLINASTLGTANTSDFAFNSSMTVAYVADTDAYTSATGLGGIEKWTSTDGITWSFQYSLKSAGGSGANALVVDFSGANPIIYATSGDGTTLFDVTDTGSSATDTTLDTAANNEAFRGLEYAPVPEPSVLALCGLGIGFPALRWLRRSRKA